MPSPAPLTTVAMMANDQSINITAASLRGSPSDRIIKPRPRKDSLQSISGSDSIPGRVTKPRARKSPGSGAKRQEASKRRFICSFSHYGCDVALSSKNEWKRHVSIQHLQLGFYRCDVGPCNPELTAGIPGHKRVYNDFNRKDLFTQHHRRMHKPESGPGSGTYPESSADWKAFEDSLESVRQRCWVEKRKPPQRSTCGFCGRVFEGDGSWNDRMEHVGGHFSRDVIEAKQEREDEDLTNWALHESIIKDGGNGQHVLSDQPANTLSGQDMSMNHALIDPSISNAYQDPTAPFSPTANGTGQSPSAGYSSLASLALAASGQLTVPMVTGQQGQPGSPTAERRNYNLAPPPLGGSADGKGGENGSGDRLEDLIHQLTKPKEPSVQRRLTWKCVCCQHSPELTGLCIDCIQKDCTQQFAVNVDENDAPTIAKLQEISIVCGRTNSSYLKTPKIGKYRVVKCDELEDQIWRDTKLAVEKIGTATTPVAATETVATAS